MNGLEKTTEGGEGQKKTPQIPPTPQTLFSTSETGRGLRRGLENQTPPAASLAALLGTLEGLGVSISITPEEKLRLEPASSVPAELLIEVQTHRTQLLEDLKKHRSALPGEIQLPDNIQIPATIAMRSQDLPAVPGLPSPLAHLVAAAASDRIKGGAQLPSGMVMDLGAYVLAWAATYLVGDQAQALARLHEARSVWGQS